MNKQQYEGWLTSNSMTQRALAVMGHLIFAYLIIVGISFIVGAALVAIGAIFQAL